MIESARRIDKRTDWEAVALSILCIIMAGAILYFAGWCFWLVWILGGMS